MLFHQSVRPYYACRAEALLQSWICGDIAKLQVELDYTVQSWLPAENQIDRFLLELLKVVARGMRCCPDLYAQRAVNPAVGVYLDLLRQLSTGYSQSGNSRRRVAAAPGPGQLFS